MWVLIISSGILGLLMTLAALGLFYNHECTACYKPVRFYHMAVIEAAPGGRRYYTHQRCWDETGD